MRQKDAEAWRGVPGRVTQAPYAMEEPGLGPGGDGEPGEGL